MTASDGRIGRQSAAAGLAMVLLAALCAAAQNGPPPADPRAASPAVAQDAPQADAPAAAPAPSSSVPAAGAAPAAAAAESSNREEPAGIFPVIKTLGAVGLVLSLFAAALLVLRKYAPGYFTRRPVQRSLRLVETLPMGEKRSIAVIEVAGRMLLVGNTPGQITLLVPLGEELSRQAEEVPPARAAAGGGRGRFVDMLVPGRGGASRAAGKGAALPPDLRGKMRELRAALES